MELLNEWWNGKEIANEILQARVVQIHKKGDASKFENYRPIPLLKIPHTVFAAAVRNRLMEGMDPKLQHAQFGLDKAEALGNL